MKRIVLALLALFTALTLLACGDGDTADTDTYNADESGKDSTADSIADGDGEIADTEQDAGVSIVGDVAIDETNFPDEAFRNFISTDYDKDRDGVLSESERSAVTGMAVSGEGIKDLTGIEYFGALTSLGCDGIGLTSLDVSGCTELQVLGCRWNELTELNVSKNTKLTMLLCNGNKLTSIDVSANTALTTFNCDDNLLTSLDISKNTALIEFGCTNNSLAALDVSKNTALERLHCYGNSLTSLDISKNSVLNELKCYLNDLTELDVTQNTALSLLVPDAAVNVIGAHDSLSISRYSE